MESLLRPINSSFLTKRRTEEEEEEEEEDSMQIHQQQYHYIHHLNPTANIAPTHSSESHSENNHPVGPIPMDPADVGPTRDREKKKKKKWRRKRPPAKRTAQETEAQRMNHIAVERNRRQLMNCHLSTLRSLMPSSFVPRGDQATIIGGAIEFVKQLEQLLLSLQTSALGCAPTSSDEKACQVAALVQGHVSVKVLVKRKRGLLTAAVAAMEEMGLTVLHLNVNTVDAGSVFYSLNLKVEDGCGLGTADEVATAVHRIFGYVGGYCD